MYTIGKRLINAVLIALLMAFVAVKPNVFFYQDAIMKVIYNHIDTLHNQVITAISSTTNKQLSGSIKQMAIDRLNKIINSFKTLDPETLSFCKYKWSNLYYIPVIFEEYADAVSYVYHLVCNNSLSDYSSTTRTLIDSLIASLKNFYVASYIDTTVQTQLVRLNNFRSNVSSLLSYHIHKLQKILLPEVFSLVTKASQYPAAQLMYKNMNVIHKNVIDTIASVPNCGLSFLEKKDAIKKLNDIVKCFGETSLEHLTKTNLWGDFVVPNAFFKKYGAVLKNCDQILHNKPWELKSAFIDVSNKISYRRLFFSYENNFTKAPIFDALEEIKYQMETEGAIKICKLFAYSCIAGAQFIGALYYFSPNIFVYLCKNNYLRTVRQILLLNGVSFVHQLIVYNEYECLREAAKNGHKEIVELLLNQIDLSAKNYEVVFYALKNNDKEMIALFFDHVRTDGRFDQMKEAILARCIDGIINNNLSDEEACEIIGPHFRFYNRTDFSAVPVGFYKHQLIEFYKQKLIYGCFCNDPFIIKFSYQNIRKLSDNVYTINTLSYNDNESLLHFAVRYGNKESVKTLLKLGHNPNCVNKYGDTPFQLAEKKTYDDIIQVLLTSDFFDLEKVSGTQKRLEIIKVLGEINNNNDTNEIKQQLGRDISKKIVGFIDNAHL